MKYKILLVDDSKENRTTLKTYLSEIGYSVISRRDEIEALKILKKKKDKINIVIIDVKMPKIKGEGLIQKIRETSKTIGIIIITFYSTLYHENDYRKLGADDYIIKPFEPKEIKSKIEKLLYITDILKLKK